MAGPECFVLENGPGMPISSRRFCEGSSFGLCDTRSFFLPMRYIASVSDYFKIPKWGMNTLLGAVAILIPIVGPIVLGGWHITLFWAQGDEEDPAQFPPFDFQYFGKYLERGLWPFLVNLAASFAMVLPVMCLMIPFFLFMGLFGPGEDGPSLGLGMLIAVMMILQIVFMLMYQLIVTPMMIASTVTQDFKSAFRKKFLLDFMSLVWREQIVSLFFMFGLGLCLMVITVITCYIGMFFAAPITMFSWYHLQKQIYQLYLSRGGEAIPRSVKLRDVPPRLLAGVVEHS